jgi:hypothetical protein
MSSNSSESNKSGPGTSPWNKHAEERRNYWTSLTPLERLRWLDRAREFADDYAGAVDKETSEG